VISEDSVDETVYMVKTMKKSQFKRIKTEKEFLQLLKAHKLYRAKDVTFEGLGDGNMYIYTGDDFEPDLELLEELEPSALLVIGNVESELLRISDILADFGVFCVTGNVSCTDMLYRTESTGVVIGGDLNIENIFYADCGNSVLQVNGGVHAKLFYNSQCTIEVGGKQSTTFDESITVKQLATLGIEAKNKDAINEAVRDYFGKYDNSDD